jgi:hypothetical protein
LKVKLQEHAPPRQCAYCHSAFDAAVDCRSCGATYHLECARELGRCAVLGCIETVGEQPSVDSWIGPPRSARPWVWGLSLIVPFATIVLGVLGNGLTAYYALIVLAVLFLLALAAVIRQGAQDSDVKAC